MPKICVEPHRVITMMDLLEMRADSELDHGYQFLHSGDPDGPRASLSYRQLAVRARAIGAALRDAGAAGQRVILLMADGLELVEGFFGSLYAGAVPVPTSWQERTWSRLVGIVRDSDAHFVLTTRALYETFHRLGERISELSQRQWVVVDTIEDAQSALWTPPRIEPSELAFLQYTSGSTGTPKGVCVSHENLIANFRQMQAALELTDSSVCLGWLPLFHDMGLILNTLCPLFCNMQSILFPPMAFLKRPRRWLQAISRFGATVSGGPNFAYDFCVRKIRDEDLEGVDLSTWTAAVNGAERVSPQTLERFSRRFSRAGFDAKAFVPGYGLAEATLMVSGAARAEVKTFELSALALQQGRVEAPREGDEVTTMVSCGPVVEDTLVRIVDPDRLEVRPAGHVGEIWVAGPSITQGYWRREDTNFEATLPQEDARFFRTGDMGCLIDGELVISGRLKDLIIIRGQNHYPDDIEPTVASAHPRVRDGCCVVFSVEEGREEQLVVAAEVDIRGASDEQSTLLEIERAARERVAMVHGLRVARVVLLRAGAIPKTSSGKLARRATRALFLSGSLNAFPRPDHDAEQARPDPAGPDTEAFSGWLTQQVARLCGAEPSRTTSFQSLGLDSAQITELAGDIEVRLSRSISPALLFEHTTIDALAQALTVSARPRTPAPRAPTQEPIAIVGMACRFPGGVETPEQYWQLLEAATDAITEVPPQRWKVRGDTPQWGGFLSNIEQFDAGFFQISGTEANSMDPQQRLLLECAWEAVERSGTPPERLEGSQTGVFMGISHSDYLAMTMAELDGIHAHSLIGAAPSVTVGRISYFLGLNGPNVAVDTACSSSLVAVHQACQAIRSGECEQALAGGVNLTLHPSGGVALRRLGALSPTGRCRPFGADADGFVRAEGCGVVFLKTSSAAERDGDTIIALIGGSAVNHDGRSNGLTAPNGGAQRAVVRKALASASMQAADLDYVECHGTGTSLGDPIELEALAQVFGDREQPLWIGSVKSNIGHAESAAGIAGLIKGALCLQHGSLPASLHADEKNEHIQWERHAIDVVAEHRAWPREPRALGVSSFGISGTNAHVVLRSAAPVAHRARGPLPELPLLLSGHTPAALAAQAAKLASRLVTETSVPDVLHSLATTRTHFRYRMALLVDSGCAPEVLAQRLQAHAAAVEPRASEPVSGNQLAVMFTGQGSQVPAMAKGLYEAHPAFREALDRCAEAFASELEVPLLTLMVQDIDSIHRTDHAQAAIFSLGYALFHFLESCGVTPSMVMGHSLGEITAACVAGVFSLRDAATLVGARGRLMRDLPPGGAMVSLEADALEVEPLLDPDRVSLAAVNTPGQVVISGEEDAVAGLTRLFADKGRRIRRLPVDRAFHSPLMRPMLRDFRAVVRSLSSCAPRLTVLSCSGSSQPHHDYQDPELWVRHIVEPVWFQRAVLAARAAGATHFLELGPKPVLASLALRCLEGDEGVTARAMLQGEQARWPAVLQTLCSLHMHGHSIAWDRFFAPYGCSRVSLPTYAFQRQPHWMKRPGPSLSYAPSWRPLPLPPMTSAEGRWSLLGSCAPLEAALTALGAQVLRYSDGPLPADIRGVIAVCDHGARPVLELMKHMAAQPLRSPLWLLTRGAAALGVQPRADQALFQGLERVFSLEHSQRRGGLIDLPPILDDPSLHAVCVVLCTGQPGHFAIRSGQIHGQRLRELSFGAGDGPSWGDGVVLITGGLGALGGHLARWLAEAGARRLVLASRRGPQSAEARAAVETLRSLGAEARVVALDVSQRQQVRALVDEVGEQLVGVFHAAGSISSCALVDLEWTEWEAELAAKVEGARHLAEATEGLPLEAFVLFGSVAGVWGGASQGSYSAANAFLCGLAEQLCAAGREACCVSWGPWTGGGMASAHDLSQLARRGLQGLQPQQALATLGRVLGQGRANVVVADVDWAGFRRAYEAFGACALFDELPSATTSASDPTTVGGASIRSELLALGGRARSARILEHLRGLVAIVLHIDVGGIGERDSLLNLGVDSILAQDLLHKIEQTTGVRLALQVVWNHPELGELRELLERDLPRAVPLAEAPPVAVPQLPRRVPLSRGQQRLWFLEQLEPGTSTHHLHVDLQLDGPLDVGALEQSLRDLVQRHEALRTCFEATEQGATQVVHPAVALRIPLLDASDVPLGERPRWLNENRSSHQAFSLQIAPLLRCALARFEHDLHVLMITVHHLVIDGWSWGLLMAELDERYQAHVTGNAPPFTPAAQFERFVVDEAALVRSPSYEEARRAWSRAIEGTPILSLPVTSAPSSPTRGAGIHRFTIAQPLVSAARSLAETEHTTLYTVVLSALAVVLQRHSGQDDFCLGTVAANRSLAHREIIGFLVNTLPIRCDLQGNPTFVELLRRLHAANFSGLEHQALPFDEIVQMAARGSALFDVVFAFESFTIHRQGQVSGDLSLAPAGVERGSGWTPHMLTPDASAGGPSHFGLVITMAPTSEGLIAAASYDSARFHPDFVEALCEQLSLVLEQISTQPDRSCACLNLLTSKERARLACFNDSHRDYPNNRCVHELFEARAEHAPEDIALVVGQTQIRYGELNARANQLARCLRARGVETGDLVAISLQRSAELIVSVYAVLKAGAAYVPIDPGAPVARQRAMLEDCEARFILTTAVGRLPQGVLAIRVDTLGEELAEFSTEDLDVADPAGLAYVIYTSGSTGRPKGAMNGHRGIVNRLLCMQERFELLPTDRLLQKSPFEFDFSIDEIFWPLMIGAQVVIAPPQAHRDPQAILDLVDAHQLTSLNFVPSMLEAFLDVLQPGRATTLRRVVSGGEALPRDSCTRFFDRSSASLINLYGPTEAAVSVTGWTCRAGHLGQRVPIGVPNANTQAHIVDAHGRLQPVGAPGELVVAGAQVGLGYLNRPDLTAESFVEDPMQPGARAYRTGDLARWRHDGVLEYLGRLDDQVKIRGVRIEPGEVEAAIRSHEGIERCVVVAHGSLGGQRLVAYFEGDQAQVPDLRRHLIELLPGSMLPSALVPLERLPTTASGKLDRASLPDPSDRIRSAARHTPPRTDLERTLAEAFAEVLGVDTVGVHESFFAIGGHSLLAIQLVSRLRERLNLELELRTLFEAPSVAALAQRVGATSHEGAAAPIRPRTRGALIPLTAAQQRLWVLDRLVPGRVDYNISIAWTLEGELDLHRLESALRVLSQRHESLRTWITVGSDDQPTQEIRATSLELQVLHADGELQALALARDLGGTAFDLTRDALVRVAAIRISPTHHILVLVLHHIIADGWSIGVLARELGALYRAPASRQDDLLPALAVQVPDYAIWQAQQLSGGVFEERLSYWRDQLGGLEAVRLPLEGPRPAIATQAGDRLRRTLDAGLLAGLSQRAQALECTLFMLTLAAFKVVLARTSGQTDIAVGAPFANRALPELEPLVGLFVNMLVLRTDLSGEPTVEQLVARVKETCIQAQEHRDVPFERVVDALGVPRDLSRNPLFQIAFSLHNTPAIALELPQIESRITPVAPSTSIFDLTLHQYEVDGTLELELEYNTSLFTRDSMSELLSHYHNVLARLVAVDVTHRALDLEMMDEGEHARIQSFNDTVHATPDHLCLHELFEARARQAPQATALVFGHERWTYGALNARANQLAHLLRSRGVGPGQTVAVRTERSFELVMCLYAILKAGAVYVPVDPGYPQPRQDFMLADCGATMLLTQRHLGGDFELDVLIVDDLDEELDRQPSTDPLRSARATDPAYMIYTSGSTGQPKGAVNSHRGVVNRLLWMQDLLVLDPLQDRYLQKTPYSFDVSVCELFLPLMVGAPLVIAAPNAHRDPQALLALIEREHITMVHFVPSMLDVFLDVLEPGRCPSLRHVLCNGEILSAALRQRFFERSNAQLHNLYGPTEAAIGVTHWRCQRDSAAVTVPIGKPIWNTAIEILDAAGRRVPVGATGELYICGVQLGLGYHDRPELTAERFVCLPRLGGAPAYRTGDRGRWRADGVIEFLGRTDHQIKLRGHRIELGEVEKVLETLAEVAQACVGVRDDSLVAYVVLSEGAHDGYIAEQLRALLPEPMVPSRIRCMDELPLSANGKVDRVTLALVSLEQPVEGSSRPANALERELQAVVSELLGCEQVGVEQTFFELGGQSLSALRLLNRLSRRFSVQLDASEFFRAPTISSLARAISSAPALATELALVERPAVLPLSAAQERLWVIDQLHPGSPAYNVPLVVELRGALCVRSLEAAFEILINRHEVLRAVFRKRAAGPYTEILPPVEGWELSVYPGDDSSLSELYRREALRPFDLSVGPLLRTSLHRSSDERHALVLVMHHIVCDGLSLDVLLTELSEAYEALRRGQRPSLTPLRLQYPDFAVWERQRATSPAQLAYWMEQLAGLDPLVLPADRQRPAIQSSKGASLRVPLPATIVGSMRSVGEGLSVTPFMVALAAFKVLLARYTGVQDIAVGVPFANRPSLDLEDLIGFFVSTLVLRDHVDSKESFSALVERVRQTSIDARRHQDVPFERVVEALGVERDMSRNPLFQVAFSLQDEPRGPTGEALQLEIPKQPLHTSKLDLHFVVTIAERDAWVDIQYCTALYDAERIHRMARHYCALLVSLTGAPLMPIARADMLGQAERHQLLSVFAHGTAPLPERSCLHTLFEAQVVRTPDALAVLQGDRRLSYGELDQLANGVAGCLRELGIGLGDVVALALPRGIEATACMFGVMKAGAAFLPLDPAVPLERLRFMLEDSAVAVLVGDDALCRSIDAALPRLDPARLEAGELVRGPWPAVTPSDLAYVLYTSGTTGKPSGVGVRHAGFADNRVAHIECHGGRGEGHRVLAAAAPGFDASVFETVLALLFGAALVFSERADSLAGRAMSRLINSHQVDTAVLTPTVLSTLVPSDVPTLTTLISAGEVLPDSLARTWSTDRRLFNLYGPTEASIWCTYRRVEADEGSSDCIGRPKPGSTLYVLDADGNPSPIGVPGELHIAGSGVAAGYVNRPELTAARFLVDPFRADGSIMFRSGDFACWTRDGELRFLGRVDRQVKVNGVRVELGAVEATLARHPAVSECVVTVTTGARVGLVAYVVSAGDSPPSRESLRNHLREYLPQSMVPSVFVPLERLPMTTNGKLDLRALPSPTFSDHAREQLPPRTAEERAMHEIWAGLLDVTTLGVRDNFFDLGGSSLLAVQLIGRIEERWNVTLNLRLVFQHPTIEALVELLTATGLESSALVPINASGDTVPVFCVHPAGGFAFPYIGLARALGADKPFYALQDLRIDQESPPHMSVEELAAGYLDEIRRVRPRGPYILSGWSFGGLVAFEIARVLVEGGEQAEVMLFDTESPGSKELQAPEVVLSTFVKAASFLYGQLGEEIVRSLDLRMHGVEAPPIPANQQMWLRAFDVFCSHVKANLEYRPPVSRGRVTLLRAMDSMGPDVDEACFDWSCWACEARVIQVPGAHETMIHGEYLSVVAHHLEELVLHVSQRERS